MQYYPPGLKGISRSIAFQWFEIATDEKQLVVVKVENGSEKRRKSLSGKVEQSNWLKSRQAAIATKVKKRTLVIFIKP